MIKECPCCGTLASNSGVILVEENLEINAKEYVYCIKCGFSGPKKTDVFNGGLEYWNKIPRPLIKEN